MTRCYNHDSAHSGQDAGILDLQGMKPIARQVRSFHPCIRKLTFRGGGKSWEGCDWCFEKCYRCCDWLGENLKSKFMLLGTHGVMYP